MLVLKERVRLARHRRIRKRIKSSKDIPRLCIHRSLKNLYIQVMDDQKANIMFSFSTLNKEIKDKIRYRGNIAAARILGEVAAEKLKQKGIKQIVFDRGGYPYHGRIKAVTEELRKGGITF